jgi:hypothetical protein
MVGTLVNPENSDDMFLQNIYFLHDSTAQKTTVFRNIGTNAIA